MHDPRPQIIWEMSAILQKLSPAMKEQSIHERSSPVANSRMNNHSGWFIYNDNRIIFIKNIKGNIFSNK